MFKSLSVTLLMGQSWSPCPLLPKLSCPWVVAVLLPGALGQQTGPVLRAAAQMFVLLQQPGLTGKGLQSCATGASITPDKGKGHFQGHSQPGWLAGMAALAPAAPHCPAQTISAFILISLGASAGCFSSKCFKCQTRDTVKYQKRRLDKGK